MTVPPSTHLPKLETYWYSLSPPTPSLSLSPFIHSALRYLVRNPFCRSAPPSGTQTSFLLHHVGDLAFGPCFLPHVHKMAATGPGFMAVGKPGGKGRQQLQ